MNLQVLKFDFCAFLRPYQVYVATAIGNECFLGASIAKDVGEKALQDAYQVLKKAGTIEAVYKLSVNDNGAIWLKDQATVEIYEQGVICLSLGFLAIVSKEMEAEDELKKTP